MSVSVNRIRGVVAFAFLSAAAACGGGGDEEPIDAPPIDAPIDAPVDVAIDAVDAPVSTNPGFPVPTAVTKANMRQGNGWVEIGDANWSCLGTPSSDAPSTQAITLTGRITDFQNGDPVGAATITAFPGVMTGTVSGTATSSNVAATRGSYTMTVAMLPAGTRRFGFQVEAAGYLKTYFLNQYFDPTDSTQTADIDALSELTANALPAFIGITRDPADGLLIGTFRDCLGREVSNAVATVSATSMTATHLPGADTYYFSAGTQSLPVRHAQSPTMNKDGLFAILGVAPAASAYVQIWGFRTTAELAAGTLTLLSELAAPIEANTVVTASFAPRRQ